MKSTPLVQVPFILDSNVIRGIRAEPEYNSENQKTEQDSGPNGGERAHLDSDASPPAIRSL